MLSHTIILTAAKKRAPSMQDQIIPSVGGDHEFSHEQNLLKLSLANCSGGAVEDGVSVASRATSCVCNFIVITG